MGKGSEGGVQVKWGEVWGGEHKGPVGRSEGGRQGEAEAREREKELLKQSSQTQLLFTIFWGNLLKVGSGLHKLR